MNTFQKGFSLIELMIVIAIIGILAAIAIPSYQTYVLKSKMGELMSAGGAAELAAAEYVQSSGESDCSNMPIVAAGLGPQGGGIFQYPSSQLVNGVYIYSDCSVIVNGNTGQWGSQETTNGFPFIEYFATPDSNGGYSWNCYSYNSTTFGQPVTYAPTGCPSFY